MSGRIDLPDVPRDEDQRTSRRGGVTESEYRRHVEALEHDELVNMADGALVVANALELLGERGKPVDPRTLQNLADILRVGLRNGGR